MTKFSIYDYITSIKHDQNDKALIVVDRNHTVIEKEREEESHTKIKLAHQEISTKLLVCKFKF